MRTKARAICVCGKDAELGYSKCPACWKFTDPRYVEKMQEFLLDMTLLAKRHDVIVAENSLAASFTYEPYRGPKLYWDSDDQAYVMKLPTGEFLRA